jgi:hypothetical protein
MDALLLFFLTAVGVGFICHAGTRRLLGSAIYTPLVYFFVSAISGLISGVLGILLIRHLAGGPDEPWIVALFIIVGFVVAWVSGLSFLKPRRPKDPDHCQRCDYDLTGNVSGVCPECGTKVTTR